MSVPEFWMVLICYSLRVLRQRRYTLAGRITALYYTLNWKRASGVIALKACLYLVQPDSVACWSGCSHGQRHPGEPRAYIYTHSHARTHTHTHTFRSWVIQVGQDFILFPTSGHSHLTFAIRHNSFLFDSCIYFVAFSLCAHPFLNIYYRTCSMS